MASCAWQLTAGTELLIRTTCRRQRHGAVTRAIWSLQEAGEFALFDMRLTIRTAMSLPTGNI
jgi:hypothetical protein